jgi:AraC-like DNA-binding protein
MPSSTVLTFADPHEHQSAILTTDAEVFVTEAGRYSSQLIRIEFHRLLMQCSTFSLGCMMHSAINTSRRPIFFLADDAQPVSYHSGMELPPRRVMFYAAGSEHYFRSSSGCRWNTMSLTPEDLAAAGVALVGQELTAPESNCTIRPPPHVMGRLLRLYDATASLAEKAPEVLSHPEAARAIEENLVRAMVHCLTDSTGVASNVPAHTRRPVMRRFERILAEKPDQPLYITQICAALGVAERTLSYHCLAQLGMPPHRYLRLRRMHMARRALALADAGAATVTTIANHYGFAELGRFAIAYRELFGESPSVTLRRAPDLPQIV